MMTQSNENQWGYMDMTGKVVIDFQFDHASPFHEGLALVTVAGLRGFIDRSGQIAVEPQFGGETREFSEGRAVVQLATGKCGFIDRLGQFAVPPIFDWGQPFSEGLAQIQVNGKYGYISKDGKVVIGPEYEMAGNFSEGVANVANGNVWHFVDASGQIVFGPFEFAEEFSEGVARIWHDGGDALLRSDGTIVSVRGVNWLSAYFSDGLIEFSRTEQCGYLDRDGVVIIPPTFDEASTFSDGLAAVQIGGKWGYIDTDGAIAIDPRFDEANSFVRGMAHVRIGGESRYISRSGDELLRTNYKPFWPFSHGVTPVYI